MSKTVWPLLMLFLAAPCSAADREPAVAGSFYPADPKVLAEMVDRFLDNVPKERADRQKPLALVSPHAGFEYSGQTAAYTYDRIAGHRISTVVLVGPCHRVPFKGASVWKEGSWKTPLGAVPVDAELASAIASEDPSFEHGENVHLLEHSLETQLPFLQRTLKDFKIVPIVLNDDSPENVKKLGAALFKHLKDRPDAIVIASTDMSHYRDLEATKTMDARTLGLMKKMDVAGLGTSDAVGETELCGQAAVRAVLEYGRLSGASLIKLHYSTSADASGDASRVVGYGASAIFRGYSPNALTQEEQKALLGLARTRVEAAVAGTPFRMAFIAGPSLQEKRAVFVTINKDGQLRGCIGRILPEEPLVDAVQHMAIESALKDPRFPPVEASELSELTYEVSVLSPPERVMNAEAVEIGKHGVILKREGHGGVFLPKVAESFGNDKEAFLSELCSQKAGLPRDCWKDPATEISVFTAQEFSEAA